MARMSILRVGLGLLFLASSFPTPVQTFRPTPSSLPSSLRIQNYLATSSSSLQSKRTASLSVRIEQRQTFIVDGGELQSFLLHNDDEGAASAGRPPEAGCLTFVTGTTPEDARRVIGVPKAVQVEDATQRGNTVEVYAHTLAAIPAAISDGDAMSTAAAAVVGIHCAIPKVEQVGGSEDGVFYSGKAVVMGGNDYADFISDGLATLGIDVSLVSTGGIKARNKQVKVLKPAVGEDELGFAAALGQFDSLIDTLANERKGMRVTSEDRSGGSSVLQLLRARHSCATYISTLTLAQQMIMNDGVLFGPGKAKAYLKSTEALSPTACTPLVPAPGFGASTLQVLLERNVLYPAKNTQLATLARGWTLPVFWEETSWPRDSRGTGERFGLPVAEEEEEDLDAAFRREQAQLSTPRTRVSSEGGMDDKEARRQSQADQKNPYVTQIVGVEGLAETVIAQRRDCVIFVAMRSCRTCKSINSVFTKIARERDGSELLFAKADATGVTGKALGKQLGIVSVPSFVFFRNGVRYGAVSSSKLPSSRFDRALQDLEAGEDFDTALEEEDED